MAPPISLSDLSYVADTIAETHKGISGPKIVTYCNHFASAHNVRIPHASYPFDTRVGNKRTALLENLRAFPAYLQYALILEICEDRSLAELAQVQEVRQRITDRYSHLGETSAQVTTVPKLKTPIAGSSTAPSSPPPWAQSMLANPQRADDASKPVVVLLTVNDHETDALLDEFLGIGEIPVHVTRGGLTYADLGVHGGCQIVHTVCEMGAGGVGASQQRTSEAIEHWHPAAIIAVGIAFGLDETKQAIGDVLVATQIQDYELARVNENGTVTPRGDKPSTTDSLRNRFRQTDNVEKRRGNWPKVRFGLVLSGQKLVDSIDYRASLKALYTEAVGGEMEAVGVYGSAHVAKTDWIVVKAICDWGYNKNHPGKDAWQRTAAKNAARVVKAAIDAGGLYCDSKGLAGSSPSKGAETAARALEFVFTNNIDCYSDDDGPYGDGLNPLGTYVRFVIQNNSEADVSGVQAFLRSVEKDGVVHIQNRRPLLFSPHRPGDPPEKAIKPHAMEVVDILRIDVANNRVAVPTKGVIFVRVLDNAGTDVFEKPGSAVIAIEVVATGMKMLTVKLNFEWHGKRRDPAPVLSVKSVE